MIIQNEIYIVYGQDMEGRDVTPYYFLSKLDACKFAMENRGRMAYNMPTVERIAMDYDTNEMSYNQYSITCDTLSMDDIQNCEKEMIK